MYIILLIHAYSKAKTDLLSANYSLFILLFYLFVAQLQVS